VERLIVVKNVDGVGICKGFLEKDNHANKSSFHESFQLSRCDPNLNVNFIPIFFTIIVDLLIQVMVICKVACASFKNISFMPTHKLVSLIGYWQTFDIMLPKTPSYKRFHKLQG
jgi:hypothetical protein